MTQPKTNSQVLHRGTFFWVTLIVLIVFSIMTMGVDVDQVLQRTEIHIPEWYFYIIFSVNAVMIVALVLLFFFKRLGLILFPISVLLHFSFHIYFLGTFLYTDLMTLFMYFALGLLYFVPLWDKMK
ncbi:hypothetical protein [Bergeyella zoohelcum]|uniref:Uncharacterized protein n=1 Tax=Bergeyella zoohelcum TaxID=1015 RepID=A0A7Z9CGK7_9FLAO|nr:hypothetical protein [Bergeyella zoohelcum]VDH05774.1 Uncharacterised protein [Bergeyella zoohelcum]